MLTNFLAITTTMVTAATKKRYAHSADTYDFKANHRSRTITSTFNICLARNNLNRMQKRSRHQLQWAGALSNQNLLNYMRMHIETIKKKRKKKRINQYGYSIKNICY